MLDEYNFELPSGLIAQSPAHPRDHARLLVYKRDTGEIIDSVFYKLDDYLVPKSTLVLNDSKVEKCRLRFPGNIEIFILEVANPHVVTAMVRPGKKFRIGTTTVIETDDAILSVETLSIDEDGLRRLKFSLLVDDPALERYMLTPLPPYIKQDESLAEEYQNVYAEPLGSKAAPTAGLHFTRELLNKLAKDHPIAKLTLHVGLGTFAPLKQENITQKRLHSERFSIDAYNAAVLNKAKHVTAVGTTTVRTLESACIPNGFYETVGTTEIFIQPGYKFQSVDSMITNFHLPSTSLLMLVAAFIADGGDPEHGTTEIRRIYQHAIEQKYRFYSFGDAMLIL